MRLVQVQDQPTAVATSVNEFVKVLIEAVAIVLAVSFISLGLHKRPGTHPLWRRWTLDIRPGLVVGITIPLVLAMTFLAMHYWGIGLHKISLGSLIIALGLLVDDAIIAVEMMVRKMEEGYDKVRAATFAYELTAMPMLTGTLITAAGFLPIGIAKSVTGEYTFAIFAVTVIALVLSWIVSVYFVPYLGTLLLKTPPHVVAASAGDSAHDEPHEMFDSAFYKTFRRLVNWCVEHRWITIGATVLMFALGIVGMGKVQQQFFPDSSRREILVDLWHARGHVFCGDRGSRQTRGGTTDGGAGRDVGQPVGRLGRAALLFAAGPDIPADQRVAVDRAGKGPEDARSPARQDCRPLLAAGVSRGARPREAAAERAARALSGAVPRGRARSAGAARACRRGQGADARRARTPAA